jgi:4-hydroxybenzoate polyprenyltransferase
MMLSFVQLRNLPISNTKMGRRLAQEPSFASGPPQVLLALLSLLWSIHSGIAGFLYNLYIMTKDDTPTFVIPETIFGLAAATTASLFIVADQTDGIPAMRRLNWTSFALVFLRTLSFNWLNLFIFDLSNQRISSAEDKLNKPWRPIPSGRMTESRMRHWLLIAIPVVFGYTHVYLHAGTETALLFVHNWMYNDLGGGDGNWLLRNGILASGFSVYNLGSMKIAASYASVLVGDVQFKSDAVVETSSLGYAWVAIISGVIFTTMHVQDLKDLEGDRARGRRTAPIIYGHRRTGWTIAVPVLVWTVVGLWFWNAPLWICFGVVVLGSTVAWRCVTMEGPIADRRTWHLWCVWTVVLYLLPPLCVGV